MVVKPSELAPAAAQVMAELLPRYLDPAAVKVSLHLALTDIIL